MNSLPEPASSAERRQALQALGMLAFLRLDRSYSEDEVAQKLGFGSVEAMRIQLKRRGVPEWMLDEAPANERSAVERRRKARRSRYGDGASAELPAAGDAAELFLRTLEKLEVGARDLKKRQEFHQEKRFVTKKSVPLTPVHRRDEVPDQIWQEICARHGKDPATTEVVEEDPISIEVPVGGSKTPLAPLPALIAAYALSGEPLGVLMDKLHPLPEGTDREALVSALANIQERLELAADQLAQAMRGGEVKRGPGPGELSWVEMWAVKQIREGRGRGQTDEEIRSFLRAHPELSELGTEEFSRLANLPLP
jgi:hypothetical protein